MRKEYRQAVRRLFTDGLAEALPGFVPCKVAAPTLVGGESVYCRTAVGALRCSVLLVPDAKGRQAFTVELAWSIRDPFPEVGMRPSLMLGPEDPDPVDNPAAIVRLGGIARREDVWWDLPDPAMERPGDLDALRESMMPIEPDVAEERAGPAVRDALAMLEASAGPFFARLEDRWSENSTRHPEIGRGSEDDEPSMRDL